MDEELPKYEPGSVVWVRLGPFWWPGEVVGKNDAPEDLTNSIRKPPIAVVKFEDGYIECVLSHDTIHPYNCEKKSHFIKKGMNAFRAKNPKMASFPKDVTAAEVKTGGNANIISEEEALNEPKRNYEQEVFGTPPSAKKSKNSTSSKKKGRGSTSASKPKPVITHRRFLGYDDFEVRILIQGDGKEQTQTEQDDVAFKCPSCTFTTDRMAMLMLHTKTHIKTKLQGSSMKKPAKRRKKLFSDDDQTNSDGEKKQKTKRKYRKKGKTGSETAPVKTGQETPKSAETVADIIANWDDDDDENVVEDEETASELENSTNLSKMFSEDETTEGEKTKDTSSCFDFDENEDESIPESTSGRKIPRVIPEKRKSNEDDPEENQDALLEDTYRSLMEETEPVPIVPEELVPETKSEQNFHQAKTVKYPDKTSTKDEKKKTPRRSLRSSGREENPDESINDDLKKIQEIPRRASRKSGIQNGSSAKISNPENEEPHNTNPPESKPQTSRTRGRKSQPESTEQIEQETAPPDSNETPIRNTRAGRKSHLETNTPRSRNQKSQESNLSLEKIEPETSIPAPGETLPVLETPIVRPRGRPRKSLEIDTPTLPEPKEEIKENEAELKTEVTEQSTLPTEGDEVKTTPDNIRRSTRRKLEENPESEKPKLKKAKKTPEPEPAPNKIEFEEKTPEKREEIKEEVVKKVRKPSRWDQSTPEERLPVIPPDAPVEKKRNRWDQKEKEEVMPVPEEPKTTEATKLTNPKKRFVKSFEDFEMNKTAIPAPEPTPKAPEPTPKAPEQPEKITFKLKKPLLSKISNIFEDADAEADKKPKLSKLEDEPKIEIITKNFPFESEKDEDTEYVQIDGNLKVVSEKELGDGQIELTTTPKKMKSILNFSMDFSEEETAATPEKQGEKEKKPTNAIEIVEKPPEDEPSEIEKTIEAQLGPNSGTDKAEENHNITIEEILQCPEKPVAVQTPPSSVSKPTTTPPIKSTSAVSEVCDLEEHIPSQIVCSTKGAENSNAAPSKSKLMTRLTCGAPPETKTTLIKTAVKTKTNNNPVILRGGSVKTAGKARILNQTIIKPAASDLDEFDINSMPIVLSDEILTPESIENMPVMIEKTAPKTTTTPSKILNKTITLSTTPTNPAILKKTTPISRTIPATNKIIKHVTTPRPSGSNKYIVVKESASNATTTPKAVLRKPIYRKTLQSVKGTSNESTPSTGHKIMIVTNQHGQQQRLLLTPATQKLFGVQNVAKSGGAAASGSPVLKKVTSCVGPSTSTKSTNQIVQKLIKNTTTSVSKVVTTPLLKKVQKTAPKLPQQKTILIKNHQGQIVKKIQGTDDALLDKQVAEQLEAIKASNLRSQKSQPTPPQVHRKYTKTAVPSQTQLPTPKSANSSNIPPPLAPLKQTAEIPQAQKQERPLNQLVIQDNMGNQTTVTEGQILALPSETVDGQPQSYMLVTLDESGNLTPLNNEALMSLDPNLAANLASGGDLGNMVLQLDSGAGKDEKTTPTTVEQEQITKPEQEEVQVNLSGESGQQQIILTGDPLATQKFLDSLSEGNADLSSILSGAAEGGNSFLIQTDGQQILINTEANSSNNTPSTDILAAALADTDVFQQQEKQQQQQQLFPISNVLETSLTLNSPIMTPLEVPSSKKIPDEDTDILSSQNVKNVDLPITVTDPNISQTVKVQQAQQFQEALLGEPELYPSKSYGSMPLLELDEGKETILDRIDDGVDEKQQQQDKSGMITSDGSFMEEGLCTLGGAMCSSLSEPPPEMFDIPNTSNENSMEIPIQPQIVADLKEKTEPAA